MTARVTVRDVARRAGVSPSLVSRILRGQEGYASAATRAAIQRAAAELSYRPNALAQQLRSGRTTVVGVLFHRLAAFNAFAAILTGIEDVLRPAGYSMLVSSTDGPDSEREALQLCRSQQAAGVILTSSLRRMPSSHLAAVAADGYPLVAVNRWLDEDEGAPALLAGPLPRVLWDNAGGGASLARLLVRLGHRRLAIVSDQPFAALDEMVGYRQRVEAMSASAVAAGAAEPVRYTIQDVARGRWAGDGVSAFLGITDDTAAEVIHLLRRFGIGVPEQVSVTGFTDTNVAARVTPRLTTARLPFETAGRTAARALLRLVAGDAAPALTVVPCPIVERESCAPVTLSPPTAPPKAHPEGASHA